MRVGQSDTPRAPQAAGLEGPGKDGAESGSLIRRACLKPAVGLKTFALEEKIGK